MSDFPLELDHIFVWVPQGGPKRRRFKAAGYTPTAPSTSTPGRALRRSSLPSRMPTSN